MTRFILGLLLALLLGAPATAAAQRLGPPPFDTGLQILREQRARFDRSMDQLQAQQQLLELQLLRQSIDRQTQEQQRRSQRPFWQRLGEDE